MVTATTSLESGQMLNMCVLNVFQLGLSCFFIYAEPSTAPTGFAVLSKGSSSVTLTWNELKCSNQNGLLLGYVISYTPNGGTTTTAALPTGSNEITGLTSCTRYTFTIAAWNSAGIGPYSPQLAIITTGMGNG